MNGEQMRYNEGEINLIKNTFKDNDGLLKLLRKVFAQPYDPNAPIHQTIDAWMAITEGPLLAMTPEDVKIWVLSRNKLLNHIEMCLTELQVLANREDLTEEQKAEKQRKNSTE